MSTNAFSQLLGRKQPIRFHNRLFGMDPFGFNGVEPGALSGQEERQDAHALARLFDLLVVLADPGANHFTDVPGGIVPDQEPVTRALGCQALTTILQELNADRTHRTSRDEAQPGLGTVGILRGSCLPQDAIAGQGPGVRVVLLPALFDQANGMLCTLPGVETGLGKATPPYFVQKADGPVGLLASISNQAVTSFFLSRYCGSGLLIQCLARFQLVFKDLSARRTLSSETSVGVIPRSKLT